MRSNSASTGLWSRQPATVLNRSGMPRSVLPGESGGCSTRLCCGRGSSRRPGYPTVGAAGQIRESRGERPCSLGRPFRSKSGGHRRLPLCGVRDTGRRSWGARRGVRALRFGARARGRQRRGRLEPRWRHRPAGARRIRVSSTGSIALTAISPQCSKPLSPEVLVRGRRW